MISPPNVFLNAYIIYSMCGNNGNCGCKKEEKKSHHDHDHHHNHHGCGCDRLYDSNSVCGSNIPCILNSYRLNRGTKEKYIVHYHLKRSYHDHYRNWDY